MPRPAAPSPCNDLRPGRLSLSESHITLPSIRTAGTSVRALANTGSISLPLSDPSSFGEFGDAVVWSAAIHTEGVAVGLRRSGGSGEINHAAADPSTSALCARETTIVRYSGSRAALWAARALRGGDSPTWPGPTAGPRRDPRLPGGCITPVIRLHLRESRRRCRRRLCLSSVGRSLRMSSHAIRDVMAPQSRRRCVGRADRLEHGLNGRTGPQALDRRSPSVTRPVYHA